MDPEVALSFDVAALRLGREGDAEAALVRAADQALYKAKAARRNQVWVERQEIAAAA